MNLDDVQGAYDEALRRVLLDLPPDLVDATITVDFTAPDELPYCFTTHGGGGRRTALVFTVDPEEATFILADQVQEDVFETMWSASWPQCRWHDHPPGARLRHGRAVWVCGQADYTVARIGDMKGVRPPRRRS